MKFISILRQDLNKTIMNGGFAGAAFITALLGFTAGIYTDMSNEKSYSVLEAIFTLDKNLIQKDYSFASIVVFQQALGGYVSMFLPIIVAFPFMVSFCAERNNGLMRFTITRAGKCRYYLSKFLASFLGGGLAVAIGVLLFGLTAMVIFPPISNYFVPQDELVWLVPGGSIAAACKTLLSAFLLGAVSTMPAFFISSFCRNPYIITCLPFMLNYVWETVLSKITSAALESGDFELYDKISPFYPTAVSRITFGSEFDAFSQKALIFNAAYVIVLLVGFIAVMNGRIDKGA